MNKMEQEIREIVEFSLSVSRQQDTEWDMAVATKEAVASILAVVEMEVRECCQLSNKRLREQNAKYREALMLIAKQTKDVSLEHSMLVDIAKCALTIGEEGLE